MTDFHGIIPALVTPFDADGRFARDQFARLLRRVYGAGVHGAYVCGSTGEGMLQSVAGRKLVAEAAVELSPPGKQIIVHVGATTTADALELTDHAARVGAHAISSLPPLVGSYSFAEIKSYYEELAAAAKIPLFVYFFPEVAPAVRTAEQIQELCSIPNVVGAKFTEYDLFTMTRLEERGAMVFYGRDEMLAAGLLFGARGGIGSTYGLLPELIMQIWRAALENRWDEAREAQRKVSAFLAVTLRYPFVPALKTILGWGGIDGGPCLAPRRSRLNAGEAAQLREELERDGLAELLFINAGVAETSSRPFSRKP